MTIEPIPILKMVMEAYQQPCCMRFKTTEIFNSLLFEKICTKRMIRLFRKDFKFTEPLLTERADIAFLIDHTFSESVAPLIKMNLKRKWVESGFTEAEAEWIGFLAEQLIEKWTKRYRMEASIMLGAHLFTRIIALLMYLVILLIVLKKAS